MDFRRHIRIALLGSVLLAFALMCNQCLPLAGSGAVTPAMGCGATSTSNLTLEGSDGSNDAGYDSGPVDLPVTISKNIDGVDATSPTYTPLSGGSMLKKSAKSLLAETDTQIGVVKFYLKDHECGTVLVIKDGEITEVLTSDEGNGCIFSDYITEAELNMPIAYTAVGPATTVTLQDDGTYETNGGDVSPIVIGIVKEPVELVEDYQVTVITTNISEESELGLTIADDAKMAMATTSDDLDILSFSATDADGLPVLASLEENGGEPEVSLALSAAPDWLLSTRDEIIQLTTGTTTTGTLFDSDLNILDDIALDYAIPGDLGSVALQPGGNALAYAVELYDPDMAQMSMGIGLITGLLDGEITTTEPKLLQGVDSAFESMALNWTGSFEVVATTKDQSGLYTLWTIPLAEATEENLDTLPNLQVFSIDLPISQVEVATSAGSSLVDLYYLCTNPVDLTVNDLCVITITAEGAPATPTHPVVILGYNIESFTISPDRVSYATLAVETDPPSLCFFDLIGTDVGSDVVCSAFGVRPVISPANPNVVGYIADLEDTNQVGIYNVDNNLVLNPEDLTFPMQIQSVPCNSITSQVVEGGMPPYTYSIAAGSGSIDEDTGIFIAGETDATTTVRVTDTAGATATKTIRAYKSGSLQVDWGGNDSVFDMTLNRPPIYPTRLARSLGRRHNYVLDRNSSNNAVVYDTHESGNINTAFGTEGVAELTGSVVNLSGTVGKKLLLTNYNLIVAGDATYSGTNPATRKAFVAIMDQDHGQLLTDPFPTGYDVPFATANGSEQINDAAINVATNEIYLAGTTTVNNQQDMMVIKYRRNGNDTTYGTNDGRVILSGSSPGTINRIIHDKRFDAIYFIGVYNGEHVLGKLTDAGLLDISFGNNGMLNNLFPGNMDNYSSLVFDNEHRMLYVGGNQINNTGQTEWYVVRFNMVTNTINETYTAANTDNNFRPQINGMCMDFTNRKILAVMQTTSTAGDSQWYLVSLTDSGDIDSQFGNNGVAIINPTTGFDAPHECSINNTGNVNIVGTVDGGASEDNAAMYHLVF